MKEQRFPAGWDEQRVRSLLEELDGRTEEEWAASEGDEQTVITAPVALVPEIRRLLAAHKPA